MKSIKLLLILVFVVSAIFAAEDNGTIPEIVDIPGITTQENTQEKNEGDPSLKMSGILDGRWQMYQLRKESSYYKLFFVNNSEVSKLSAYMLELYLNGDYSTKYYGLHVKTHSTYISEGNYDFAVYEAYNFINIGSNFLFEFGKRILGWGKGYVVNPVGYFNPKKEMERPELTQEGIFSSNIEYTKSFNSHTLRTLAFTFVVVPPLPIINEKYGRLQYTEYGAKMYALFFDTDIDLLLHYIDRNQYEYGLDFSRNVGDYFEIRGELNCFFNKKAYGFGNDTLFNSVNRNGVDYLAGFRFVPWHDVTIVGEYFHNDAGLTKSDYFKYLVFMEKSSANNNPEKSAKTKDNVQSHANIMMLMNDYIYLKVTKSDLFGILYLSLSPFILFNIQDYSFIGGPVISYNPFSNFEVAVRQLSVMGKNDSEYGSKHYKAKIEFEMRVYF